MNKLRAERLAKGWTQRNMAEFLGISRGFYGLIEGGARRPTFGLANRIADCFGVEMAVLFFDYEGFKMKLKTNAADAGGKAESNDSDRRND